MSSRVYWDVGSNIQYRTSRQKGKVDKMKIVKATVEAEVFKSKNEKLDMVFRVSVDQPLDLVKSSGQMIVCHAICVPAHTVITSTVDAKGRKDCSLVFYLGERPISVIPMDCLIEVFNGKYKLHAPIPIVYKQSSMVTITAEKADEIRSGTAMKGSVECYKDVPIYLCCTIVRLEA